MSRRLLPSRWKIAQSRLPGSPSFFYSGTVVATIVSGDLK
jgi:hypothetical protein